jgi:hypothetical protein
MRIERGIKVVAMLAAVGSSLVAALTCAGGDEPVHVDQRLGVPLELAERPVQPGVHRRQRQLRTRSGSKSSGMPPAH